MTEHYLFKGAGSGPRLLVFGAVHGDEVCGPAAIKSIMKDLESGALTLSSGSVTFVPVANPKAYEQRKRLVEENLNRVFKKTEHPASYEQRLANELCLLMDETDVFLDIHSASAPGGTNVFIDYPEDEGNKAFAFALPADYALVGWPSVYEGNAHGFGSFTTNQYAHEAGAVETLIECGQHDDPQAIHIAREAIMRTLAHFKMIALPEAASPPRTPMTTVRMEKLFACESVGDRFIKEWSHLEQVPEGTLIAERASGEQIIAADASIIIFPKIGGKPGEEWFYLGEMER